MWSIRFLYLLKFPWLVSVLCLFIQEHLTVHGWCAKDMECSTAQADPAWCHWSWACSLSVLLVLVPGVFEKCFSPRAAQGAQNTCGVFLGKLSWALLSWSPTRAVFQICNFNCWGRIFWKHVGQCHLCPLCLGQEGCYSLCCSFCVHLQQLQEIEDFCSTFSLSKSTDPNHLQTWFHNPECHSILKLCCTGLFLCKSQSPS